MARQRQNALAALLTAALCVAALALPVAARGPGAVLSSRIDAADPLLDGLELNLEGVAHVKRHLLQLVPPTVKYAPCAADELTCAPSKAAKAAAPAAKSICCKKLNFACGVRVDNGQPRCAVCPQICAFTCLPGWVCGKKDGCYQCIEQAKPVCSSNAQCPTGQLCDTRTPGGACIADPCSAASPCPLAAPICTVSSSFAKVCSAAKKRSALAPVKALRRLAASRGSASSLT